MPVECLAVLFSGRKHSMLSKDVQSRLMATLCLLQQLHTPIAAVYAGMPCPMPMHGSIVQGQNWEKTEWCHPRENNTSSDVSS